jgi:hypothetical protein
VIDASEWDEEKQSSPMTVTEAGKELTLFDKSH